MLLASFCEQWIGSEPFGPPLGRLRPPRNAACGQPLSFTVSRDGSFRWCLFFAVSRKNIRPNFFVGGPRLLYGFSEDQFFHLGKCAMALFHIDTPQMSLNVTCQNYDTLLALYSGAEEMHMDILTASTESL
jgi:hypothetical protein